MFLCYFSFKINAPFFLFTYVANKQPNEWVQSYGKTQEMNVKQRNGKIRNLFCAVFALEHVIYCKQEPWQHFFLFSFLNECAHNPQPSSSGTTGKRVLWKQCMQWVYGWLSVNHIDKNVMLVLRSVCRFHWHFWMCEVKPKPANGNTRAMVTPFSLTIVAIFFFSVKTELLSKIYTKMIIPE